MKFTFLLEFKGGETRTTTRDDTDEESARQLVWADLPGADQERNPKITLVTTGEASS